MKNIVKGCSLDMILDCKCDACKYECPVEYHHIMPNQTMVEHIDIFVPLCHECHVRVHCFYRNSEVAEETSDEYHSCYERYEEHKDLERLQFELFLYFAKLYYAFKKDEYTQHIRKKVEVVM